MIVFAAWAARTTTLVFTVIDGHDGDPIHTAVVQDVVPADAPRTRLREGRATLERPRRTPVDLRIAAPGYITQTLVVRPRRRRMAVKVVLDRIEFD